MHCIMHTTHAILCETRVGRYMYIISILAIIIMRSTQIGLKVNRISYRRVTRVAR